MSRFFWCSHALSAIFSPEPAPSRPGKLLWYHPSVITNADVIRHPSRRLAFLGTACTRNDRYMNQSKGNTSGHCAPHRSGKPARHSQPSTTVLHRTQPVILQWISSSTSSALLVPSLTLKSSKFQSISRMEAPVPVAASWPKIR